MVFSCCLNLSKAAFTILTWDIPKSNIATFKPWAYNSAEFSFPELTGLFPEEIFQMDTLSRRTFLSLIGAAVISLVILMWIACQSGSSPDTKSAGPPVPVAADQAESGSADAFALNLHRNFEHNGYDVSVRANHQHELILTSDSFQDASARDSVTAALTKDPKTLCDLGIWYIKVGYSKSMLEGDVMKTASLGCAAAKSARLEETKPLRDEIARSIDDPDSSGHLHVHTDGSTLVVESGYFFDNPQNGAAFADAQAQALLRNSEKLCAAAITQVQIKGNKRVIKTVPVRCN